MKRVAILCVYRDGELPAAWFQVVRRLRSQADRAGLDVDVRLAPLSLVSPDADVIMAPAGLAAAATARVANATVVTVPANGAGDGLAEVMARLLRAAPARPLSARRTVVRQGSQVVPAGRHGEGARPEGSRLTRRVRRPRIGPSVQPASAHAGGLPVLAVLAVRRRAGSSFWARRTVGLM